MLLFAFGSVVFEEVGTMLLGEGEGALGLGGELALLLMHASDPVLPEVVVPAGQLVHVVELGFALNVLISHATQAELSQVEYWPAGQERQDAKPVVGPCFPAGHASHSVRPCEGLALPCSQSTHPVDPYSTIVEQGRG